MRSTFSSTAVNDLARVLGENAAPTQKAVDGLLPTITSGVINYTEDGNGAATLYQLLKTTPFDTDPSLAQLAETSDHRRKAAESGNDLLRRLFGDSTDRLADATAQYSGVSTASASTLAGLVMSVLMGYLHKQITTRNLSEAQLASLLRGAADTTRQAVPAALAGILGLLLTAGTRRPVTTTTTVPTGAPVTPVSTSDDRTGTPWWKWLLLALGLLLLFLLITRMCNRDENEGATSGQTDGSSGVVATDTIASDTVGSDGTAGAGAVSGDSANGAAGNGTASSSGPEVRVGVDLPGGRRLNVAENSFNYSLARYLADKSRKPNKVFTFDNLTFESNSAQITAQARPHVDDLIQIMQAYPTLAIRIEGNTDSTGPDAINDPLSADRAEAVKQALVKAGIDAGRVTTRERGENKPVASNKTETGREKNRRIDVIVTKV